MNNYKDKIARYGYCGVLSRMYTYLFSFIGINYQSSICFEKALSKDFYDADNLLSYRILDYNDFKEQVKYNPSWFDEQKLINIQRALEIVGTKAYGLYDQDLLISYGFISTHFIGLSDTVLSENDCYLWDAYTHPTARGKRLHRSLTMYIERQAYRMGKKRVLVIVAAFNKASSKTYRKLGIM